MADSSNMIVLLELRFADYLRAIDVVVSAHHGICTQLQ